MAENNDTTDLKKSWWVVDHLLFLLIEIEIIMLCGFIFIILVSTKRKECIDFTMMWVFCLCKCTRFRVEDLFGILH